LEFFDDDLAQSVGRYMFRERLPLPTWVQVGPLMRRNNGTVLHGQSPGFLASSHNPLVIDQDLLPNDVRVEAVTPDSEVPLLRLSSRRNLLDQVSDRRRQLDRIGDVRSFDSFQQRALDLLTSSATAKAFDLAAESPSARDRYGRTQFGQCCPMLSNSAGTRRPPLFCSACFRAPRTLVKLNNQQRGQRVHTG
jgi:hypothetical protein